VSRLSPAEEASHRETARIAGSVMSWRILAVFAELDAVRAELKLVKAEQGALYKTAREWLAPAQVDAFFEEVQNAFEQARAGEVKS
jgi:hypothetical protein